MSSINKIFSLVAILFIMGSSLAQTKYKTTETSVKTYPLGKDTIYSNKSIADNISSIADFTHTSQAIAVTGIEEALGKYAMYTYFIPANSAYTGYSKKEMDSLFKKSNPALKNMLLMHAIPGRVDRNSIEKAIEGNNGNAYFKTLGKESLHFRKEGKDLVIISPDGSKVYLKDTNFRHANGIFHIVDNLVKPKS